jgi:hypothetical protein
MKPLNVLVAEALGCAPELKYGHWRCRCSEGSHGHGGVWGGNVLSYGEESPEGWACTGPLMGRFRIDLSYWEYRWVAMWFYPNSSMASEIDVTELDVTAFGATACEAIARCVVALQASQQSTLGLEDGAPVKGPDAP